ncbi:heparan-alpha-glucosaminide N-acetyltransferase [Fervidicella metallireducens]|uniref:heparan-alpha-glucosaminide N-acetyltransferase n=1 Tax=Fervidicella metallireducens TaxID=655338 RepID=UPI000686F239|nr:heparan-alpha-glucosaminide N-acetyltransferase [Fervidicella metallireducens]
MKKYFKTEENKRIWEIDFLRSIAIILMISFHIIYDINEYLGFNVSYDRGFWFYIGKTSAVLFITISGICTGLAKNNFKRGLKILAMAMLITIATFIFDRRQYVRFGILHLLGISIILSPFFLRLKRSTLLIISVISLSIGYKLNKITINNALMVPFGVIYNGFITIDYYPIFPYIGVFAFGVYVYKKLYFNNKSLFSYEINLKFINFLSRHSLKIYLVHQPIILIIITLIKQCI